MVLVKYLIDIGKHIIYEKTEYPRKLGFLSLKRLVLSLLKTEAYRLVG